MDKFKQIGRVSSASVLKCTGKNWNQWVTILEKAGCHTWTHPEIVAFLKKKYKLSAWWQQGVTHGFELAIGRIQDGQNAKGEYQLTVTKSFAIGAKKLWPLLVSKTGTEIWLKPLSPVAVKVGAQFETEDGFFGEVRTMKKDRRIRFTWQDPNWSKKTTVQIHLVDRPGDKSILVLDHGGIIEFKAQELLRKRWKKVAEDLRTLAD